MNFMKNFFIKILLQHVSKLAETVTQASCLRSQARGLCYGCLFIIFLVSSVQSQQRDQLFPGARPFGLGEAFVAIANDGNAIYWNPAGLPYLKREEVNLMYSDLYGININNFYLSYTRPIMKKLAFGVDWLNYGFDDEELSFGRNYWNFSSGYAFNNNLAVGGNFKYVRTNTQLKGTTLWDADASGWGMDFGILFNYQFKNFKFLKEFRAGLMLHDAFNTYLRFNNGTKEKIHSTSPRFGFCYKLFDELSSKGLKIYDPIIAVDVDDRFHLGSEVWFLKNVMPLALRAGVQKDFYHDEGLTWSAGFSVQKNMFRIDYAYTMPPTLPATHRFSIAFQWNYNPFKVEIADINVKPIFAALRRHYDKNPIGEVILKSDHGDSIRARASFEIEGYTKPAVFANNIIINPGGKPTAVPLQVDLGDTISKITDQVRKLHAKIMLSYQVDDKWYDDREEGKVTIELYGNDQIQWDVPARAAAFVTKNDNCIASFSMRYRGLRKQDPYPRELIDAISIYEALRSHHVTYIYDPTPIAGFDKIKWPADILTTIDPKKRGGDCEDLSVLYAALLENAGIYTALLKSENHVFLMFNTMIPITQRFVIPLPDSLLIKVNGYIWLPIDPTNIDSLHLRPFHEALQQGISCYHKYKEDPTFHTIFINEEQREGKYPPIKNAPVDRNVPEFPDLDRVKSMVAEDISEIDQWRADLCSALKTKNSQRAQNQLGCIYVGLSNLDSAKVCFERALKIDAQYLPSLNNLANIYFIQQDYENAYRYYQRGLQIDKLSTGAFFNLALLFLDAKDNKIALKEVTNIDKELDRISDNLVDHFIKYEDKPFEKMHSIMGLHKIERPHTTAGEKKSQSPPRPKKKKRLLERLMNILGDKLVDKSPKSKDTNEALQTGIDYPEELRLMLYWEYEEERL